MGGQSGSLPTTRSHGGRVANAPLPTLQILLMGPCIQARLLLHNIRSLCIISAF